MDRQKIKILHQNQINYPIPSVCEAYFERTNYLLKWRQKLTDILQQI